MSALAPDVGGDLSSSSPFVASAFRVLPQWQQVEVVVVEMMGVVADMQLRQAARNRRAHQQQQAAAAAALAQKAAAQQAQAAAAQASGMVAVGRAAAAQLHSSHGTAASASSSSASSLHRSSHSGSFAAADHSSSSSSAHTVRRPPVAAAASAASSSSSSSDPEPVVPAQPFLAHFHLLSHLLLELDAPTLERLISFLDPSPAVPDPSAGSTSGGTIGGGGSSGAGGGMALAFRLLDSHTQTQLVELLLKCVLQHKELLDKAEQEDQYQAERAWHRDAAARRLAVGEQHHSHREQKHDDHERKGEWQGEGEANPGEGVQQQSYSSAASSLSAGSVPHMDTASSAAGQSSSASSAAAGAAQLRLLHLLRRYAGMYRLSHILHRCVDYHNWLAAAVAMESRPPSSSGRGSNDGGAHQGLSSMVLVASGALDEINGAHLADAMECRLKHVEQRAEAWRRWKAQLHARARALDPVGSGHGAASPPVAAAAPDRPTCPSSLHVPLLVSELLPPLPADVWLSFDPYAVETGRLLMQLVLTHLVHVPTVAEQARLIALLMRGWREWDLPSLLLESIFLSNLISLADALNMLAFQKGPHGPARSVSGTGAASMLSPASSAQHAQSHGSHYHFSTDGSAIAQAGEAPSGGRMETGGGTSSTSGGGGVGGGGGAAAAGPAGAAPIFSAKLYLALTHYRLNAVYRSSQQHSSGPPAALLQGVVAAGLSASGSGLSLSTGAPPSLSQLHRLWSEIIANLHRDLEAAPTHLSFQAINPPPPMGAQGGVGGVGGVGSGAGGAAGTPRGSSRANELSSLIGGNSSPSSSSGRLPRTLVAFTCGHSFSSRDFAAHALPEFLQSLSALVPPIPITTKFLQAEYKKIVDGGRGGGGGENGGGGGIGGGGNGSGECGGASAAGGVVVSLACPSCVLSTLTSLQQKHESIRQATLQSVALRAQQQAAQQAAARTAHAMHVAQLQAEEAAATMNLANLASSHTSQRRAEKAEAAQMAAAAAAGASRSLTPTHATAMGGSSSGSTALSMLQHGSVGAHSRSGSLGHGHSSSPSPAHAHHSGLLPISPAGGSGSNHSSPRHRTGLSLTGNVPKVMFGRVAAADLDAS